MGSGAPSRSNNLQKGMCGGRTQLDQDGKRREQNDLDGSAGGVPQRAGDAELVRNVGALQQGGGPGPLRDDDGGGEAGADGAAGGVEVLGVHGAAEEVLVEVDERDGGQAEGDAEGQDDGVAHGRRQRGVVEEAREAAVLREVEEVAHDLRAHVRGAVEVRGGRGDEIVRHDCGARGRGTSNAKDTHELQFVLHLV